MSEIENKNNIMGGGSKMILPTGVWTSMNYKDIKVGTVVIHNDLPHLVKDVRSLSSTSDDDNESKMIFSFDLKQLVEKEIVVKNVTEKDVRAFVPHKTLWNGDKLEEIDRGMFLDAKDKEGDWYGAEILSVNTTMDFNVHFLGFDSIHDEVISFVDALRNGRFAQYGSYQDSSSRCTAYSLHTGYTCPLSSPDMLDSVEFRVPNHSEWRMGCVVSVFRVKKEMYFVQISDINGARHWIEMRICSCYGCASRKDCCKGTLRYIGEASVHNETVRAQQIQSLEKKIRNSNDTIDGAIGVTIVVIIFLFAFMYFVANRLDTLRLFVDRIQQEVSFLHSHSVIKQDLPSWVYDIFSIISNDVSNIFQWIVVHWFIAPISLFVYGFYKLITSTMAL